MEVSVKAKCPHNKLSLWFRSQKPQRMKSQPWSVLNHLKPKKNRVVPDILRQTDVLLLQRWALIRHLFVLLSCPVTVLRGGDLWWGPKWLSEAEAEVYWAFATMIYEEGVWWTAWSCNKGRSDDYYSWYGAFKDSRITFLKFQTWL